MFQTPRAAQTNSLRELDRLECEALLATASVGRVGYVHRGHPTIQPVNFRFFDGEVLFRTFNSERFGAAQLRHVVAFEVDSWTPLRSGWSVLLNGRAVAVIEWARARAADELGLDLWIDGDADSPWIRIKPFEMSGCRVGAA